jgi:hypothetical protein
LRTVFPAGVTRADLTRPPIHHRDRPLNRLISVHGAEKQQRQREYNNRRRWADPLHGDSR